jgi:hypothetical protein
MLGTAMHALNIGPFPDSECNFASPSPPTSQFIFDTIECLSEPNEPGYRLLVLPADATASIRGKQFPPDSQPWVGDLIVAPPPDGLRGGESKRFVTV